MIEVINLGGVAEVIPATDVITGSEGPAGANGRDAKTDLLFAYDGKPDAGHVSAGYPVGRAVTYQATLVIGCLTRPLATTVYQIMNNGVPVGTATFNTSGPHAGTLTTTSFGPGDFLYAVASSPSDGALYGPAITLLEV